MTIEVRETEVIVTTDSFGSQIVRVRQEPAETPVISISLGSAAAIDSEGGSFTAVIRSNYAWTAALAEEVEGWEFSCDEASGRVTVTAGPNHGDAISGTVLVRAGNESFFVTDEYTVTQDSRADNFYFSYIGSWLVHSSDAMANSVWAGMEGSYTSCVIEESDYAEGLLKLSDWGYSGIESDRLQYSSTDCTVKLPLGYLCGTLTTYAGLTYYLYLVVFNDEMSSFSSDCDLLFTLSEDGATASVSGPDDDHPIVGLVGYNSTYSYVLVSNAVYCRAPISLIRSEESISSDLDDESDAFSLRKTADFCAPSVQAKAGLPEDVPMRLPKGLVGDVSGEIFF